MNQAIREATRAVVNVEDLRSVRRRAAAFFFERHSALIEFHLRDTLGRLQRYLEGLQ